MLGERWDRYVGDRDFDHAIRTTLTREGFRSGQAVIRSIKLVGASRAGWVQVYRFTVETASWDNTPTVLLGLGRDDGRAACEIRFFPDEPAREAQQSRWCEDLVQVTPRQHQVPILLALATVVGLGLLVALVRWIGGV